MREPLYIYKEPNSITIKKWYKTERFIKSNILIRIEVNKNEQFTNRLFKKNSSTIANI